MKIYIRTFGCQMNERDSEMVTGLLLERGFRVVESLSEADVVIFNTCSVRKHAEERAISNMGELAALRKEKPEIVLGLMGCTAEYYGKELFKRLPHLDFICGTANLHKIPDMIESAMKKKDKVFLTGNFTHSFLGISTSYRANKTSAYVSISRGCNNYCSYCIVPYVRGPERSREPEDIINEVEHLFKRGYRDIMLLGQNVNSYGKELKDGADFVKLLKRIDALEYKKNIKFMTSHPKDASVELFEAVAGLEGLSKHLHLPLQSGSDRILKLMNRGYDSGYYLNLVKAYRKAVSGGRLTTDIIVGFPGETRRDFEATKDMLKGIEFDAAYIFKYSPRPPAASSKMTDDITKEEKAARHRELLDLQISMSRRRRWHGPCPRR